MYTTKKITISEYIEVVQYIFVEQKKNSKDIVYKK